MDQDEGLSAVDNIVTQYNTYEDFLDSQITTFDLYYLEVSAPPAAPSPDPGGAPWRGRSGTQGPGGGGEPPRPGGPGLSQFFQNLGRGAGARRTRAGESPSPPRALPAPPSLRGAPAVGGPPRPPVTQARRPVSLSACLC